MLGDFNARSKSWWAEDITSHEGTHTQFLTTMYIWFTTTYLRPNSFASQFIIMY